ncbi:hypothetical protein COU60_00105 [Candidatus Pacearchaeota archaeon CG10_big_fil_rev_8_21_14_0_10_34_76]|nr:MAG: hypothetical protein COU60_00105 [Candidatus Pacearchaeota archaeon CG10_big_fil_rev_8_21_14_0_10_34_76]
MVSKGDGSSGLLVWSFGMLSMIFAIMQPIGGIAFGIVGLVLKSRFKGDDTWAKPGKTLSITGLILSITILIFSFIFAYMNPGLISQIQGGY